MESDAATAARLRAEFDKVRAATQGQTVSTIQDPLGADGEVTVTLNSWRHTGAGEVQWLVGDVGGDRRYVRFRSWGPNGTDFIEKSSYLKKENGHTEFHKRTISPGDAVAYTQQAEGDDAGWVQGLA